MKKVIAIVTFVCFANLSNAQAFQNKGNYLSGGVGLDFYTVGYRSLGPFMVTYARGITDLLGIGRIGVGGGLAQTFYHDAFTKSYSRTSLIGRAAYHFEFDNEKMDVYAGVGLSFHLFSGYKQSFTPVARYHYIFGGIRYYFTESIGVYGELGLGIASLMGGIVYRFYPK